MAVDFNYQIYLRSAFNRIYDMVTSQKIQRPIIMPSGGPTDVWPPYRRTEAGVMIEFLKGLARRPTVSKSTRGWKFAAESRALSTLENLFFTKKLLRPGSKITLFCEQTRVPRIRREARRVYGARYQVEVIGIDFDVSANRYVDPAWLQKKEHGAERFNTWSMKSPANLREHHRYYARRIAYFRRIGGPNHVAAVRTWPQQAIKEFPTLVEKFHLSKK